MNILLIIYGQEQSVVAVIRKNCLALVCDAWAALSDDSPKEGMPSPRSNLAADHLSWAFREGLQPPGLAYFIDRAKREELRWPSFSCFVAWIIRMRLSSSHVSSQPPIANLKGQRVSGLSLASYEMIGNASNVKKVRLCRQLHGNGCSFSGKILTTISIFVVKPFCSGQRHQHHRILRFCSAWKIRGRSRTICYGRD